MKKIMAVMLSLLACTVLLAGCNTSSESNEEQSLKVYSFSGENEYISVSNGVIILDGKDEICYLDNWESIDFDDKRKAADGLISTIKATSDRVQIEWKI